MNGISHDQVQAIEHQLAWTESELAKMGKGPYEKLNCAGVLGIVIGFFAIWYFWTWWGSLIVCAVLWLVLSAVISPRQKAVEEQEFRLVLQCCEQCEQILQQGGLNSTLLDSLAKQKFCHVHQVLTTHPGLERWRGR
jgi:hypothetical protein